MPEGEGQSPSLGQQRADKLSEIESRIHDMIGSANDDDTYSTLRSSLTIDISELDDLEE
jgi:hypothetical protein